MESLNSSIDVELVQEFWKMRAEREDNRWTPEPFLKFEIQKVKSLYPEDRRLKILDLGSGSGSLSRHLTKPNDALTAVDFEPAFERFFLQDPRFNFIHREVNKFTSNEKYNLILFFGVVTHLNVSEEEVTYKNIAAMLSEEGIAVVKNQCSDSDEFIFNGYSTDLGVHYSARYPNSLEQREKLLKHFTQVQILEYPSWSKKFANSSHIMFICKS